MELWVGACGRALDHLLEDHCPAQPQRVPPANWEQFWNGECQPPLKSPIVPRPQ